MTDEQFKEMVKKYMPEIAAWDFTDEIYLPKEILADLCSLFDYVLELKEQLQGAQHKPIGTGLLVSFPNTNAAIGVTSFNNNQPAEYIWCSCGLHYPKGQEHHHK